MFEPAGFRDLVSGRRRGVGASLLRRALTVGEKCYTQAVRWRNGRYDNGKSAVHRVGTPVVSVGNLTLGGTGKTPLVQWIARWFQERNVRVAVVSRGYGATNGQANDEAREMKRLLPNVPHLQNPNRLAAALQAVNALSCQLIVLDDGFQHRRLARDLDIVLLDALAPFGYGHVFPRGFLREPIEGLRRADVVVLSRADLVDSARRTEIWETVRRYAPAAILAEASHTPRKLVAADGAEMPLEAIRGKPVAAFCGIGNPDGFRRTLETCGCPVAGFREFPDHHRYTAGDLDKLTEWSNKIRVAAVVCTGKDLPKITVPRLGSVPLWALRVEMDFMSGKDGLESRLRQFLAAG